MCGTPRLEVETDAFRGGGGGPLLVARPATTTKPPEERHSTPRPSEPAITAPNIMDKGTFMGVQKRKVKKKRRTKRPGFGRGPSLAVFAAKPSLTVGGASRRGFGSRAVTAADCRSGPASTSAAIAA